MRDESRGFRFQYSSFWGQRPWSLGDKNLNEDLRTLLAAPNPHPLNTEH